jgi:transglutaminase/protease-like cytokinesis protein 3
LTATLTIPAAEDLNSSLYVLEIIDDIDPNNHNFSPNFSIDLVTGSVLTSTSETLVTSSTPITTSTYDDSGPGTKRAETSGAPSTADQTGTSESNGDRPALSTELIVVIAISGAVGVFVVGALWFFMVRQNRKGKKMWDTALNAVEESHTNGLSFTVEPAQDRFGRDREVSGHDTDRTDRSEVPVSYRLKGTMTPSSHELLSMLRTV